MTDEERQRQMDFIVNQQAEFSVKLDRLGEKVDALADTQQRSEEKWSRTEEGIRSLLSIAEIHEREITELKESVRATSETARAANEAGRATDERLNALVNMFERYLSERRNGKEQGNQ
ncbi:MAG: hypothetical protein H0T60_17340 [Acidobacteria bacterium]|nr:hypothetical protein [Acidobacteriota bacterium]